MEPDIECLNFLTHNSFVRNFSFDRILERNQNTVPLQNYICYTVGLVGSKRIVHAFRFLYQSPHSKIKSYYIQWWNTATFEHFDDNSVFESVSFWIHSGMTLRKNFFLYDDRMSLFRSTFIFDPYSNHYYRLSAMVNFMNIPEKSNFQKQIFTSPGKFYYYHKKLKTIVRDQRNPFKTEISKLFQKILVKKNLVSYIQASAPRLFEEVQNFIK